MANVGQAQRLPWTHKGPYGWLRKGLYEDLLMDAPPDVDKTDDEPEGLEDDSLAAWEQETRQVKRKIEMQPSSSCSLARPRGEAVLSQTDEKPGFLEHGRNEQRITTKAFCEPTGTVRGKPTEKRKVEVSVKNLSQDELRQLEQAKQNEIRQYPQNEVMEALRGNEEIRDGELMGMRWVVTGKHFLEKKAKARLVKVGCQAGDLEGKLLDAATPTPTRRAKHCFLLVAAHHGLELKKADV